MWLLEKDFCQANQKIAREMDATLRNRSDSYDCSTEGEERRAMNRVIWNEVTSVGRPILLIQVTKEVSIERWLWVINL